MRLERQDVEMLVEASVEFASVKRGSEAAVDNEERVRVRLQVEEKEARNMICETYWNHRPTRRPGAQHQPDLEEDVTSTVPVSSCRGVRARVCRSCQFFCGYEREC